MKIFCKISIACFCFVLSLTCCAQSTEAMDTLFLTKKNYGYQILSKDLNSKLEPSASNLNKKAKHSAFDASKIRIIKNESDQEIPNQLMLALKRVWNGTQRFVVVEKEFQILLIP